jgi:hypothetical protein
VFPLPIGSSIDNTANVGTAILWLGDDKGRRAQLDFDAPFVHLRILMFTLHISPTNPWRVLRAMKHVAHVERINDR